MSLGKKAVLIIILILIIDQVVKIWIKTNMVLGQEYHILGNWFIIHFTENNGMAFGKQLPGEYGKLILTSFRIVAVVGIAYYIKKLIKEAAPKGVILAMSCILAGALGNIIDSVFYGVIFNESFYQVAEFMPEKGGYASLFHGRVVDMLYFPLINTHYPSWFPFVGGEQLIFFRPVFNIADSAITCGVATILIWFRGYFQSTEKKTETSES